MRQRHHKISRYCCKCKNSTVWTLEGETYVCVGDDEKHPERRAHGCGTVVSASEFRLKDKKNDNSHSGW